MIMNMKTLAIAGVAGLFWSCGPEEDDLKSLFNGEVSIVDMTHSMSATMPFWPGPETNPFVHDTLSAHPDGAPSMAAYQTPEHHGTHIDAPVHGGEGLLSVDLIPANDLFAPLAVIDVTASAEADADYQLSVEDVHQWESMHGLVPEGAVVIMRSGWNRYWDDSKAYFGADLEGRLHFPGFSVEAARFLVDERNVGALGVDTPSVDPGNARGFPAHGVGNGSGKYHLENVAAVDAVPEAGAFIVVAPVKIAGGSGGQVRLFAVIPG
jgi:kynurenine formamidase